MLRFFATLYVGDSYVLAGHVVNGFGVYTLRNRSILAGGFLQHPPQLTEHAVQWEQCVFLKTTGIFLGIA